MLIVRFVLNELGPISDVPALNVKLLPALKVTGDVSTVLDPSVTEEVDVPITLKLPTKT